MENENKDALLIQCLIQLEQLTKGQEEIKEMLKLLLLGQNTGANAVSNCETDNVEEKYKISSMENENKVALLIQCSEQLTIAQEEIKEMLKQFLLVSGQNTGANKCETDDSDDCETDDDVDVIEEKYDEVEDGATLYIRVGSGLKERNSTWFAIPPRGEVDKGRICSLFKQPHQFFDKLGGSRFKPLAVGPHIFLISNVFKEESQPKRDVLYRNMQNEEEGWKNVNPIVGEKAGLCHFIVADDKIYAFGSVDNGDSLCVSFVDCTKPGQEWQVKANAINVGPPIPTGLFNSLIHIVASTTTTIEGKPGRRCALLFACEYRITYDFEANSYEYSEEYISLVPRCSVCPDGGEIYFLFRESGDDLDDYDRVFIKVFDHRNGKLCMTPLFGLDEYLPVAKKGYTLPPSRLVHLGNKRLCLVYALYPSGNMEVHCTKFSVRVQQDGEYHATNVSSRVYTLNASRMFEFEVVAV